MNSRYTHIYNWLLTSKLLACLYGAILLCTSLTKLARITGQKMKIAWIGMWNETFSKDELNFILYTINICDKHTYMKLEGLGINISHEKIKKLGYVLQY